MSEKVKHTSREIIDMLTAACGAAVGGFDWAIIRRAGWEETGLNRIKNINEDCKKAVLAAMEYQAAPETAAEMLEALKAMTFYLTDPVPATREKSDAVYYKCVRAIAKAEAGE